MLKNVTLNIDETLLKRARHLAVEQDKSLSGWMRDLIAKAVTEGEAFQAAQSMALNYLKKGLTLKGKTLKREDLHDRNA